MRPASESIHTSSIASALLLAAVTATAQLPPPEDFSHRAFYYARVIEIPTPRWSTIEAFRFGILIPEAAPVSTQERGYTTPIWYTP